MSESEQTSVVRVGALLDRRRRRAGQDEEKRTKRQTVRLSSSEYAAVAANAAAARLSIGAYMAAVSTAPLEATPGGRSEHDAEVLIELMGLHRQVRGAANNLNQMTAAGHATGRVSEDALAAVLSHLVRLARRIDDAVAKVARSR